MPKRKRLYSDIKGINSQSVIREGNKISLSNNANVKAGGGAIDKVGAVVGALGTMADAASKNAQLNDTSNVEDAIKETKGHEYDDSSYDNLLTEWGNTKRLRTNITAKELRALSTGQQIGNTIGSAASGAEAGMAVGGPWGAAAGAVIGTGAGIFGIAKANRKAKKKAKELNKKAAEANQEAVNNFGYASNKVAQKNYNSMQANMAEKGGWIGTATEIGKGVGDLMSSLSKSNRQVLNPYTVGSNVKVKDQDNGLAKGLDALQSAAARAYNAWDNNRNKKNNDPTANSTSSKKQQSQAGMTQPQTNMLGQYQFKKTFNPQLYPGITQPMSTTQNWQPTYSTAPDMSRFKFNVNNVGLARGGSLNVGDAIDIDGKTLTILKKMGYEFEEA